MARPVESYRGFRRAHARKLRLIWRRLQRRTDSTGSVVVIVPAEAA